MKEEVKKTVYTVLFYAGFSVGLTMAKLQNYGDRIKSLVK